MDLYFFPCLSHCWYLKVKKYSCFASFAIYNMIMNACSFFLVLGFLKILVQFSCILIAKEFISNLALVSLKLLFLYGNYVTFGIQCLISFLLVHAVLKFEFYFIKWPIQMCWLLLWRNSAQVLLPLILYPMPWCHDTIYFSCCPVCYQLSSTSLPSEPLDAQS